VLLKLLTLPISAPIAGIKYCLMKVAEVAEGEMWDEEPVREQLMLVNQAFEEGTLAEPEFRQQEAELLARLREVREHHKAMARAAAEESAGAAVDEKRRVVIDLPDEIR
jgi:gas vesicle protein GvpG